MLGADLRLRIINFLRRWYDNACIYHCVRTLCLFLYHYKHNDYSKLNNQLNNQLND